MDDVDPMGSAKSGLQGEHIVVGPIVDPQRQSQIETLGAGRSGPRPLGPDSAPIRGSTALGGRRDFLWKS